MLLVPGPTVAPDAGRGRAGTRRQPAGVGASGTGEARAVGQPPHRARVLLDALGRAVVVSDGAITMEGGLVRFDEWTLQRVDLR